MKIQFLAEEPIYCEKPFLLGSYWSYSGCKSTLLLKVYQDSPDFVVYSGVSAPHVPNL